MQSVSAGEINASSAPCSACHPSCLCHWSPAARAKGAELGHTRREGGQSSSARALDRGIAGPSRSYQSSQAGHTLLLPLLYKQAQASLVVPDPSSSIGRRSLFSFFVDRRSLVPRPVSSSCSSRARVDGACSYGDVHVHCFFGAR